MGPGIGTSQGPGAEAARLGIRTGGDESRAALAVGAPRNNYGHGYSSPRPAVPREQKNSRDSSAGRNTCQCRSRKRGIAAYTRYNNGTFGLRRPGRLQKRFRRAGPGFHLVHQLQPVAALPGHTPFDDLRAVLRCKVKTAVLRLPKGWRQKWLKSCETMWLATRASLLGAVVMESHLEPAAR